LDIKVGTGYDLVNVFAGWNVLDLLFNRKKLCPFSRVVAYEFLFDTKIEGGSQVSPKYDNMMILWHYLICID
jgi:hypothetical protein